MSALDIADPDAPFVVGIGSRWARLGYASSTYTGRIMAHEVQTNPAKKLARLSRRMGFTTPDVGSGVSLRWHPFAPSVLRAGYALLDVEHRATTTPWSGWCGPAIFEAMKRAVASGVTSDERGRMWAYLETGPDLANSVSLLTHPSQAPSPPDAGPLVTIAVVKL